MTLTRRFFALSAPLVALLFIAATPIAADTVKIPISQQGNATMDLPDRGMHKSQVEADYGEPQERRGPTGTPAIYTWDYADYTVYFEGNYVVHAVAKHQPQRSNSTQSGNSDQSNTDQQYQ